MAMLPVVLSVLSVSESGAASFPGQSSSAFARLDENSLIWINPARLADSGKGFDVGIGSSDGASILRIALHLPAGYALGWELARLRAPEESYEYDYYGYGYYGSNYVGNRAFFDSENQLQVVSLAKRGFGEGPWLGGLRLGLATRFAYQLHTPDDAYDKTSGKDPFSLDAGATLDFPIPEHYGALAGGVYASQAFLDLGSARQIGLQARWLEPSGWARMEANLALLDPQPGPPQRDQVAKDDFPPSRLSADILFRHFEVGGLWLPEEYLAGLEFDFKVRSWGIVRELKVGGQMLLAMERHRTGGSATIWLDAKIRFRGDSALAADYRAYRNRNPGTPAPIVRDTTGAPPLNQDEWQRNWALYQEDKIGAWRGTVWPYLNTFGLITTFYIPSGTSSLSVGNYQPGWILFGAWGGLVTTLAFTTVGTVEERAIVYAVGQCALKLVDFTLARRHVKAHNRALRDKYRLGVAPLPGGAALALGF